MYDITGIYKYISQKIYMSTVTFSTHNSIENSSFYIENSELFSKEKMSSGLPRLIMQTWKTNDLPDKWKPTQVSINKYMSEWDYVLMTDEMNRNFIIQHFPDFLPYYDAFPYPIQRADAIRYAWLYINGGLYLDCDFELLAPLDELFIEDTNETDLFLLASSNTPDIITNGFIAAKPGNKVFLEMIEEMKKPAGLSSIERHLLVMNTTGPLAFNRVVKRNNIPYKLLPSSKINPYTICDTEYNKPNTLLRPLPGSSWVTGIGAAYQWCYCQANYLVPLSIMIGLLLLLVLLLYFHIIYI